MPAQRAGAIYRVDAGDTGGTDDLPTLVYLPHIDRPMLPLTLAWDSGQAWDSGNTWG